MARKIRIGIDVGGTFTDAIALDNTTHEIVAMMKVPTTHDAAEGVTAGVIQIIDKLIKKVGCASEDVVFIAHGTTQATNALLEGDVAKVGIIGMGSGLAISKIKNDTDVGDITLHDAKKIYTCFDFLNTSNGVNSEETEKIINDMKSKDVDVIVASEAFSVDDITNEKELDELIKSKGLLSTTTFELTKLYGLKARTKTAVINASILPKMIETADMTAKAVLDTKIDAPLMIMRSDGGVMQIDEVKKRPILTVLSGPAAGVAGALMYEKVSDGIFLEVGGTSTDISAIQNGGVVTKYANIGGHNTYINSLDIHTIGIGGGSLVRIVNDKIADVGPRSAHILGIEYACYANINELRNSKVVMIESKSDNNVFFLGLENDEGKKYAITLTCAANYIGNVEKKDYAFAPRENVDLIFEILEKHFNESAEKIASEIVDIATKKIIPAIQSFIKEYQLSTNYLQLTGGGGGASVVVPAVAKKLNLKYIIPENAPVIATIGAALAMVRDSVEKTIVDPTKDDIISIRSEAYAAAIKSGAQPDTIKVTIDIDSTINKVTAIAIGNTDINNQTDLGGSITKEEAKEILHKYFSNLKNLNIMLVEETQFNLIFKIQHSTNKMLGFIKAKKEFICVVDRNGIVKLNLENASCMSFLNNSESKKDLESFIDSFVKYDEAGQTMPELYLIVEGRITDFSGLSQLEQVYSLISLETDELSQKSKFIILARKR